ncbi:MAG: hypothetical protein V2I76_08460 [Roseobacter sp.]|nr:hypothetical protein [Roseobacter sp.]
MTVVTADYAHAENNLGQTTAKDAGDTSVDKAKKVKKANGTDKAKKVKKAKGADKVKKPKKAKGTGKAAKNGKTKQAKNKVKATPSS